MFLHQEAHPSLKLTDALHVADWSFLVSHQPGHTSWHLSLPPPSFPPSSLLPSPFYLQHGATSAPTHPLPSLFTELAPTPLFHTSHAIKIYGYNLQTASGSEHSLPPQASVWVQTHAHHPLARLSNGPRCRFTPPPSSFLCSERVCSHCPHGRRPFGPQNLHRDTHFSK